MLCSLLFLCVSFAADLPGEAHALAILGLGDRAEVRGRPVRAPSMTLAEFEASPEAMGAAAVEDVVFMFADVQSEPPFHHASASIWRVFAYAALAHGSLYAAAERFRGLARRDPLGPEVLLAELVEADVAMLRDGHPQARPHLDQAYELVTGPSAWWNARTRPEVARQLVARRLAKAGADLHLDALHLDPRWLPEAGERYKQALEIGLEGELRVEVEAALRAVTETR